MTSRNGMGKTVTKIIFSITDGLFTLKREHIAVGQCPNAVGDLEQPELADQGFAAEEPAARGPEAQVEQPVVSAGSLDRLAEPESGEFSGRWQHDERHDNVDRSGAAFRIESLASVG